ncbi:MAG: pitrilysin family protein [Candidatus Omnitrophota bacterium]|nr:insulinase family protein [Candidatus Omnitrophota bacterium]
MYENYKTKNGLKVLASRMPHMSSISLGIWIGVGGRYESKKQSGISHLVEHMLFKGTYLRTAKELKEAIEGVGGAFNGFTSDEVTCYMVKVPSEYVELGVDILSDMVLNAKFEQEDLLKEKYVVCEEIKMYRDQPSEHVVDVLNEIMWPNNALGRPLTGTSETVKKLTMDDLKKFKETYYHPANIAVVAAGNVNVKKFFNYVSAKFEKIQKKQNFSFESPKIRQNKVNFKVCRENIKQTHIAMGFHAEDRTEREKFAIKLMNIIFGGNMSSRLFEELREKYGLCYDISSSYKRHSDKGEIHIHAGVDSKKAVRSVIAILDEIKRIRDLGVTEEELQRAKKYTKGQFLLAMEATSSRMLWLGDRTIVHKRIPKVKDVIKNIDAVRVDDIEKVCKNIFKHSLANLSMVGKLADSERKKIKKELNML